MRQPWESETRETRFALLVLAFVAGGLLLAWAIPAEADPGDIELRGYVPLAPDPSLNIGGGVAIQWAEVAAGHGLFVDILYMDAKGHLGASASLRPMDHDNGLRVFGSIWWEGGADWTCGLSQVVSTW